MNFHLDNTMMNIKQDPDNQYLEVPIVSDSKADDNFTQSNISQSIDHNFDNEEKDQCITTIKQIEIECTDDDSWQNHKVSISNNHSENGDSEECHKIKCEEWDDGEDFRTENNDAEPIRDNVNNGGTFIYTADLQHSRENLIKMIKITDKTKPLTVTEIKVIKFSTLSLEEKVKIKQRGRPTPDILIAQSGTSHNKKYVRVFNSDWYEKKKWLCGCEIRNTLFCFPCLLMGGDSVWTENGFININRVKDKTTKHELSRKHIDNVVCLSLLGSVNVIECLSESYKQAIIRHNENVIKNKKILSKIIDCIKFCGNYELCLRSPDEKDDSLNPGVFRGLVNFTANLDSELKLHLCNSSMFKVTSKTIQNDLLDCMLQICREKITTEINETSYVSLMADDTTDVSEHTQMVIVFRYELNGEVYERFWGFFNPENKKTDGLSKCILEQIDVLLKDKPSKLIAQTFDGVMRGEKGGVQLKIKQTYKNAHFIHCYADQLNSIMKHATTTSSTCRLFFTNLLKIPIFFSYSPYRLKNLNKQMYVHLPRPSATRWNFNIRTANKVYENQEILKKCFQELQSSQKANDKTITDSSALLLTLNDETFLFWLKLFHKLMPHVEILYNQMQSREIHIFSIQKNIKSFKNAILQIRNSYTELSSPQFQEARDMCDVISSDMEQRYSFNNHLLAAKLFDKVNFKKYHQKMPIEEINQTIESYPMLEKEKLLTEFQVFYERVEMHNFNSLLSLLKIIHAYNLCDVLGELTKLLKILITTPMTTEEPERCFSTLKRIKSYLRNTTSQERLTALSMLSIEKDMIGKIPNFNEKVIEKFVNNKNRRMDFICK